jgi:tetratricopeptide (TPR) repeat protein
MLTIDTVRIYSGGACFFFNKLLQTIFQIMVNRIIILLFVVFGSTVYAQDALINAELKQADRYTTLNNYTEALKHIENALDIEPLHIITLEKKVNIMIQAGKEKTLLKEIDNNIDIYPQQPEYYYMRGLINMYRQKYGKAVEDFLNADYYNMPEEAMEKIYFNRGTAYYYYGDFTKAEEDFKQAIQLNPRSATTYHSWGMLKYEQGLFDDAIGYFNKAIQYEDNSGITYYNLGMAYYKIGELKDACHNFNRACTFQNRSGCKIYYLECTE